MPVAVCLCAGGKSTSWSFLPHTITHIVGGLGSYKSCQNSTMQTARE